jgi:spore maturation protein CgeB
MAFVGGYWPYKAQQFDLYLKPYQEKLKVFGYSPWPYAGYGGQLPEKQEPSLYHQAKLSPTVNEPHVSLMGIDINERVFKVLGSGGMTITDATPAYREWFTEEELLVPTSVNEFHQLVNQLLTDEDFSRQYRNKGYQAVTTRHTYTHRAKLTLSLFEI